MYGKLRSAVPGILTAAIILFVAYMIGCGGGGGSSESSGVSPTGTASPTTSPSSTPTGSPNAKWTFMVYLACDNNLEYFDFTDVKEMEAVGSNDDVNIIVQWDRTGNESSVDWNGCRRYYITKGENATQVDSTLLEDLGNTNMGDPAVFKNFLEWGKTNYPAEKYAVVLWNHGSGWKKNAPGGPLSKGICFDDTSNDHLTEAEIHAVFEQVTSSGANKFELIGMDACLMAMIEVAYNVKDAGNYFAASEASEPGDGWPYDTILAGLAANPDMDGAVLGTLITDKYAQYYASYSDVTFSAIDLSKMDALATAVDSFSQSAISVMGAEGVTLKNDGVNATGVDSYFTSYKDLGDFMNRVVSHSAERSVQTDAAAVSSALSQAVVRNYYGSGYTSTGGLTIWIPDASEYSNYSSYYQTHSFAKDTNWDEYLGQVVNQ